MHHEPLFEAAVRELGEVLDGDITAIMRHLPARHALRIVAGSGWRDGVVGHAMIPDNAGSHSGFALISDGPVVSTDYATESRLPARSCSSTAHDRASRHPSSARTGPGASSASTASRRAASRRTRSRSSTPSRTSSAAPSAVAAWRSRSATATTVSELALAASKTGFWEWNVQSGRVVWSDEICRLHGMPPGTEPRTRRLPRARPRG